VIIHNGRMAAAAASQNCPHRAAPNVGESLLPDFKCLRSRSFAYVCPRNFPVGPIGKSRKVRLTEKGPAAMIAVQQALHMKHAIIWSFNRLLCCLPPQPIAR
jgi:hypothetical protein